MVRGVVHESRLDHNSIRLLRFGTGRNGYLVGRLDTFHIDRCPPFYTASYVWGGHEFTGQLAFKNGAVRILASLVPFLQMVSTNKDFEDSDYWWIDSICMNLGSAEERTAQVKLMDQIYRRCRRAIIWLGEEQEENSDCKGAIFFLIRLARDQAVIKEDQTSHVNYRHQSFREYWHAVGNLLSRAWWTRVWTLQEFILPREAVLYCGNNSLSRNEYKSSLFSMHLLGMQDGELIPREAFDAAWNRRRIHQWYTKIKGGMPLVATLAYLGNHQATDVRDRIYSTLGLVKKSDRTLIGSPDYAASIRHVFAKLIQDFWQQHKSLDIICFAHIFNSLSGNLERSGIPSWAPDWRAYVQSSPVPLMASQSANEQIGNFRPLNAQSYKAAYNAPGEWLKTRSKVRFHTNLMEMWADGVVIGSIDGLGGIEGCETRCYSNICASEGHQTILPTSAAEDYKMLPTCLAVIEKIARCLCLDREDKYFRFKAPPQYVSDFLLLCYNCMEPPEAERDPLFNSWFQQLGWMIVAKLSIVHKRPVSESAYTLGSVMNCLIRENNTESFEVLPPPSTSNMDIDAADPAYQPEEGDTFLSRFYDTVRKKSRRLMVTDLGYLGMAPCRARKGDVVAILFGCSIPLVLRRVGEREAWQVIGEAYVDGFMNGEISGWRKKKCLNIKTFRLV